MAYTLNEWKNKQVTAVDPYRWSESDEAKKITRAITLEKDIIFGLDSFTLEKVDKMVLKVGTGFAIKQDIYIHFHEPVILDLNDIQNYCVPATGVINQPGLYYVVLDYQYAKSDPYPIATIKIAKTYETAYKIQQLNEYEDNRTREVYYYLVLGYFTVVDNNGLEIDEFLDYDPNHFPKKKEVIDLEQITDIAENVYLKTIKDFLVVEYPIDNEKYKVKILPGYLIIKNKLVKINDIVFGPITGVSSNGRIRYDIITCDTDGNLRYINGTEYDDGEFGDDINRYIPYIGLNQVLLAIIKIDEPGQYAEILDRDDDILQVREFTHIDNILIEEEGNTLNNTGNLLVYNIDPPTNGVNINKGNYISTDNKTILKYDGGTYMGFDPTPGDNYFRYDLLCIDDDKQIICIKGLITYNNRQDPYQVAPELPKYVYPLAIIEVHGLNPIITEDEIFDARSFINMGGNAKGVSVYPTTPPSNKAYVDEFVYIRLDGLRSIRFTGGETPEFQPLSTSNVIRYDYLLIDDYKNLVIVQGNETSDLNIDPFEAAPDIPMEYHALAIIRITETSNVKIDDEDIFIATETLNKSVYNFIELRKDDWDGQANTWELPFNPDWSKPYIIIQDGVHLDEGYACQVDGNKIHFLNPPQHFTLFYGVQLHTLMSSYDIGPKSARETDWDGVNTQWDLPFTLNLSLPELVVSDGKVLEKGVGYTLSADGGSIYFTNPPQEFTLCIAYPRVETDIISRVSIGIEEFKKTDWENLNTNIWVLDKEVNTERPKVMIVDGLVWEEDVDYRFLDRKTIEFITTKPDKFTKLLVYTTDNIGVDQVAYDQSVKHRNDIDSNNILNIGFEYRTGYKQLEVFVDRQALFVELDYDEVDENRIRFHTNVMNNLITSISTIVIRRAKFI